MGTHESFLPGSCHANKMSVAMYGCYITGTGHYFVKFFKCQISVGR